MAKPLDELDIIARGIVRSTEYGLSNNIPVIKDLCRRAYDDHTISSLENNFILKNPKNCISIQTISTFVKKILSSPSFIVYICTIKEPVKSRQQRQKRMPNASVALCANGKQALFIYYNSYDNPAPKRRKTSHPNIREARCIITEKLNSNIK